MKISKTKCSFEGVEMKLSEKSQKFRGVISSQQLAFIMTGNWGENAGKSRFENDLKAQ